MAPFGGSFSKEGLPVVQIPQLPMVWVHCLNQKGKHRQARQLAGPGFQAAEED